MIDLKLNGHRDALVSLPLGTTVRRPLVVAVHGAGQDPGAWCNLLRDVVRNTAFVLCPRGDAIAFGSDRDPVWYFHSTPFALAVEIRDAIVALIRAYPPYVDTKAPIFVGFAEGAVMGAWLLSDHPARFARALLIEGGADAFTGEHRQEVRRFRERGGVRLFFSCVEPGCLEGAEKAAQLASAQGVITRVVKGDFRGGLRADLSAEVDGALFWLVDGDPRFATTTGP